MTFSTLTPYQVLALEKSTKAVKNPVKRKRLTDLGCYIPPSGGSGQQASRRITGSHLAPDSLEMQTAAVALAGSLLDAVNGGHEGVRSLVGPARYSDRVLKVYCDMLIKSALGEGIPKTAVLSNPPVSPKLVSYLLGACPVSVVEDLCWRALEVMDFMPDEQPKNTLNLVLSSVGFGAEFAHRQYDDTVINYTNTNEAVVTEAADKYKHLSAGQNWLLSLPRKGSFGRILLDEGAYEADMRRYIQRRAPEMIAEAERLLDPEGGEMTAYAARDRKSIRASQWTLQRAVSRVFERPWGDLDLKGGGQENAEHDLEVTLARCIIRRITYSARMNAETFIGMALLTGVSIANWAEFVMQDIRRRGETFITDEELERAIGIAEVSPYFKCEQQMQQALIEVRYAPAAKKKWARRLQSPTHPLWSANGYYYVDGLDSQGDPKYRHKPFSLTRD